MCIRDSIGEALRAFHYVEVILRADAEYVQHAVKHLAVLRRDAHEALYALAARQLQHQRSHFYGLGARAEYAHDFKLRHRVSPCGGIRRAAPPRRRGWGRREGLSLIHI